MCSIHKTEVENLLTMEKKRMRKSLWFGFFSILLLLFLGFSSFNIIIYLWRHLHPTMRLNETWSQCGQKKREHALPSLFKLIWSYCINIILCLKHCNCRNLAHFVAVVSSSSNFKAVVVY